jgi:putative addiction module component (TIGR02574 family)
MSDEVEALLTAALLLSREERAQLAVLLADFVEDAPSEEIERAWLTEAKRRLEEVRAGRMQTISAQEVEQKLWDKLEHRRLHTADTAATG